MNKQHHYPIIILGGGLAGLTMAAHLGKRGVECLVIEKGPKERLAKPQSDGRSYAIAYGSYKILEQCDVWQRVEDLVGEIRDIRVSDQNSSLFLHYDHTLVGNGPVGFMVENHHIKQALYDTLTTMPSVQLLCDSTVKTIDQDNYKATITLQDGSIYDTSLLIAADGKFSKTRDLVGIKTRGWHYDQAGIVCNVKHEHPHQSIAQERFLEAGPFAILPLKDPHTSSIVWTEKQTSAPHFLAMDVKRFNEELQQRFGGYLGNVQRISKPFSYPLSLLHANTYYKNRTVLIGDAAHAIHPLAGQGFNLGIRDAAELMHLIDQHYSVGLDIGAPKLLKNYQHLRHADAMTLIAITDGLNHLFSNSITPIALTRRLGLAAVNKFPALKKRLMQHAMGV